MVWLFQKKTAAITGNQTRELKIDRMGMVDWYAAQLIKPDLSAENIGQ